MPWRLGQSSALFTRTLRGDDVRQLPRAIGRRRLAPINRPTYLRDRGAVAPAPSVPLSADKRGSTFVTAPCSCRYPFQRSVASRVHEAQGSGCSAGRCRAGRPCRRTRPRVDTSRVRDIEWRNRHSHPCACPVGRATRTFLDRQKRTRSISNTTSRRARPPESGSRRDLGALPEFPGGPGNQPRSLRARFAETMSGNSSSQGPQTHRSTMVAFQEY